MVEINVRDNIEQLLQATMDAVSLRYALEKLAVGHPVKFRQSADLWAPVVYERDPEVFGQLLSTHLNHEHRPLINKLLPLVQAKGPSWLYAKLYGLVANTGRLRQDLEALAHSPLSDDKVAEELRTLFNFSYPRQNIKMTMPGSAALMLYRRNARLFHTWIVYHLDNEPTQYLPLLEAARSKGDEEFYWALFGGIATVEMWRESLEDLLSQDIPADKINGELVNRHPRKDLSLNTEFWQRFIDKYGEAVAPYLNLHATWYLRRQIETLINSDLDNEALLLHISALAGNSHRNFNQVIDVWAIPLYDRDAHYFESFLRTHLQSARHYSHGIDPVWHKAVAHLLLRAEANNQDGLFETIYGELSTEDSWNREITALANSDLSDDLLQKAIDRRDKKRFNLTTTTALALYRRNADLFGEYIRGRLQQRSSGRNVELLDAIRTRGDEDLYWTMFRRWATLEDWQAEMQSLLSQEIDPAHIQAELKKRHPISPFSVNPATLKPMLEKYGGVVLPYLEKHFRLVTRERLESLLALPLQRGTLLHELDHMAQQDRQAFSDLAEIWAPALVRRDPAFFEGFLVRNLDRQHGEVIHTLLPSIEAAGLNSLFRSLYRKVSRFEDWNYQLRELAKSSLPDNEVIAAIERRDIRWGNLTEDILLWLYDRNPDVFREWIKKHLGVPSYPQRSFKLLREKAEAAGDEEFYWYLFRNFASHDEWQKDMRLLLLQNLPEDQIVGELERRVPTDRTHYGFEPVILLDFMEKYGEIVWPLVKPFLPVLARHGTALNAIRKLDDEVLYWQTFFMSNSVSTWNSEIRQLLNQNLSDDEFSAALDLRMPEVDQTKQWSIWKLNSDDAIALYQRYPVVSRPFIQRFLHQPEFQLFEIAQAAQDYELLDFLVFKFMQVTAQLVYRAYPPERHWRWNRPDKKAQQQIKEIGGKMTAYLDSLYAQSPEIYVRHTANILANFRAFEIWSVKGQVEHNPIFAYLVQQHHEAWQQSPDGIRELMESPNIYVQILGIDILGTANSHTAQRILENLYIFQALLLGRTRRNTKKKVLACLEGAMRQGPQFAEKIAPILFASMDYRGKRAIPRQIMASYVRAGGQHAS
jgi:hypothetical protein